MEVRRQGMNTWNALKAFPEQGIEFYEYDQLGSSYADQPTDSSLWTTERFVEEVEQVRKALNLDKSNFYLLRPFLGWYSGYGICA